MVEETTTSEQTPEEVPRETVGQGKASIHIWLTADAYERVKKYAKYAAIEGLIEGHPRGNLSDYCELCFHLGEAQINQYMLKKRGYR